jgi:hypothetical protein
MPDNIDETSCTFGQDADSSEACLCCDQYEACKAACSSDAVFVDTVPGSTVVTLPIAPLPGGAILRYLNTNNMLMHIHHNRRPSDIIEWRVHNQPGQRPYHAACEGEDHDCPMCAAGHAPTERFTSTYVSSPISDYSEEDFSDAVLPHAEFRQALDRVQRQRIDSALLNRRTYVFGDFADVVAYDRPLTNDEVGSAFHARQFGLDLHTRTDEQTVEQQSTGSACKELISDCLMEGIYTKHELVERVRREFPEWISDPINDDRVCRLISDMTASDVTFAGKKIITLSDNSLIFEGICPQGRKFGLDVDDMQECETCEVYSTCAQRAIEIAGSEDNMFD